mmetsp:Transcript_78369/g.167965  ORF Transcript_78369/g.167965 Transcript_78369/m.167965 type:complete len:283 (+) Transcript_78369:840-1688(+)
MRHPVVGGLLSSLQGLPQELGLGLRLLALAHRQGLLTPQVNEHGVVGPLQLLLLGSLIHGLLCGSQALPQGSSFRLRSSSIPIRRIAHLLHQALLLLAFALQGLPLLRLRLLGSLVCEGQLLPKVIGMPLCQLPLFRHGRVALLKRTNLLLVRSVQELLLLLLRFHCGLLCSSQTLTELPSPSLGFGPLCLLARLLFPEVCELLEALALGTNHLLLQFRDSLVGLVPCLVGQSKLRLQCCGLRLGHPYLHFVRGLTLLQLLELQLRLVLNGFLLRHRLLSVG